MYDKSLAQSLRQIGCDAGGASYVIHGLLRNLIDRFGPGSAEPAAVAAAFLDDANCTGARDLLEEDKAKLREIRDGRPPAAAASGG